MLFESRGLVPRLLYTIPTYLNPIGSIAAVGVTVVTTAGTTVWLRGAGRAGQRLRHLIRVIFQDTGFGPAVGVSPRVAGIHPAVYRIGHCRRGGLYHFTSRAAPATLELELLQENTVNLRQVYGQRMDAVSNALRSQLAD